MSIRWIVTVERTGARILESAEFSPNMRLIKEFRHEVGRLPNRNFGSDRPGRMSNGTGSGRHALGKRITAQDEEQRRFIHQLVDFLEASHNRQAFHSLMIAASPRLLGVVRKKLSHNLRKCVTQELVKDYPAWMSQASLKRHLKMDLELRWC